MRFKSGDVYPVYSSLRSDPLGVKVFYESIDNLDRVSASRNYRPMRKLGNDRGATLFYLGADANKISYMDKKDMESLETMIADGGQAVITFNPGYGHQSKYDSSGKENIENKESTDSDECSKKTAGEKEGGSGEDYYKGLVDLADRWGFGITGKGLSRKPDHEQKAYRKSSLDKYNLPDSISWHASQYFRLIDDAWDEIYSVGEYPVLIQRKFGNGKIILSTGTYFMSNEAMLKERHPALLAWLTGSNNRIIFDETHLGIREQPGIASLARKYRLQWPFTSLLLLAGLFIWKNSSSLIPPYDPSDTENDASGGRDYISGFASLLRRNILPRDIMKVCFEEWKKTMRYKRKDMKDELNRIQSVIESEGRLPARQRNAVSAYQSISKIISQRRYK